MHMNHTYEAEEVYLSGSDWEGQIRNENGGRRLLILAASLHVLPFPHRRFYLSNKFPAGGGDDDLWWRGLLSARFSRREREREEREFSENNIFFFFCIKIE